METIIREKGPEPKSPIIVEGLPGLGSIGGLAASFLIDRLKARKIAELYSPYFPYQAIVDSRGIVRLPRGEFYCSTKNGRDLVIITGDCQPQTNYGQYEVATKIIQYAVKCSASQIISIGGFVSPQKDGKQVVGVATKSSLVSTLVSAGACVEKAGIPIVGIAGLLVAIARTLGLDAICLLAQTTGLGPDPSAAQKVLKVLSNALNLNLDLSSLDKQVAKMRRIEARVGEVEKKLASALKRDHTIYIG